MPGKITLETLAEMIKHGFDETASKQELAALRREMNEGFDKIENVLYDSLYRRVERLEDTVKQLKTKAGIA